MKENQQELFPTVDEEGTVMGQATGQSMLTPNFESEFQRSYLPREQVERIKAMELRLDRVSQAVMRLSAALDEYDEALASLRELETYYGSSEWKQDYADEEAGRLPKDLKRGVLSEDGVWNLLDDSRDLNSRLKEIAQRLKS